MAINTETLGEALQDRMSDLVDEAAAINTNSQNVMPDVLALSQKTAVTETTNGATLKTAASYFNLPKEAGQVMGR